MIKFLLILILSLFLLFPVDQPGTYDKALSYYSHKKFNIAKDLFLKAKEEDTLNSRIYFYLGNIYTLEKNFTEANKAYQRAIELDVNNINYYNNYGDMHYMQGLYDVAMAMYKKVNIISSNNFHSLFHMGFTFFRMQQYENAADSFEYFLKIYPNYSDHQKITDLIIKLRAKIASGELSSSSKYTSSSTNQMNNQDLKLSIDLDDIKEGGKEMETKSGESIDNIEINIDIVE